IATALLIAFSFSGRLMAMTETGPHCSTVTTDMARSFYFAKLSLRPPDGKADPGGSNLVRSSHSHSIEIAASPTAPRNDELDRRENRHNFALLRRHSANCVSGTAAETPRLAAE